MSADRLFQEAFAREVVQALADAQMVAGYRNVAVQTDAELIGGKGIKHLCDVYWEFEIDGRTVRNILDFRPFWERCTEKDWNAWVNEIADFSTVRTVAVLKEPPSESLRDFLKAREVEILVVPFCQSELSGVRKMRVSREFHVPAEILDFSPQIDQVWAKEQGIDSIALDSLAVAAALIDDSSAWGTPMSIAAVAKSDAEANSYPPRSVQTCGCLDCVDTFLTLPGGLRVKITGWKLTYRTPYVISDELDVSRQVLGIAEFISKTRSGDKP